MFSCNEPNLPNHPNQPMKLNALLKTVGFLALASTPALAGSSGKVVAPGPVAEPDTSLGITASIGYYTHFYFRGVQFAENWISTGVSFDVPLTDTVSLVAGALYGGTADDNVTLGGLDALGSISYQRLELNAGLVADVGPAQLGLGYRWYSHYGQLSRVLDEGHEVGLTVATSAGPLNFGLGAYYDFGIEGWYFEAAVNTEIKLTDSISLVPGVSIGYVNDYSWHIARISDSGFTAVGLNLALPIKLTKSAVLTPYVAANLPIDVLDDRGEDNQIFGGVRLSVSF